MARIAIHDSSPLFLPPSRGFCWVICPLSQVIDVRRFFFSDTASPGISSKLIGPFIPLNPCMYRHRFNPCMPPLPMAVLHDCHYSNCPFFPRACSCVSNSFNRSLGIRVNCEIAWNMIVIEIVQNIGNRKGGCTRVTWSVIL
jgi:hypothetical protein